MKIFAKMVGLMPREAANFIAKNSQDVTIVPEGVTRIAKLVLCNMKGDSPAINVNQWKSHELNIKSEDEAAVNWVFLTDVLNFSFWSADPLRQYTVRYNQKEWTGYWALVAAINRALDEGIPFTDARCYASITADQLEKILRSDSQYPVPLLDQRLQVLQEAGKLLMERYDGRFVNMLKEADKSAQKLLKLVTSQIPSFQDSAHYQGSTVHLYKRAQILVADIWACCGGRGYGEFHDIESVTMFADYRIPQVLAWFGAIKYSDSLQEKLNQLTDIPSGSRLEVEIRGMTIQAVELIVEEVKKYLKAENLIQLKINPILVDHYLWDYRRDHAKETDATPFHRTRCIYY